MRALTKFPFTTQERQAMRSMTRGLSVLALASALLIAACGSDDDETPAPPAGPQAGPVATITVLSNRADLVSGGDALVQIAAPAGSNVSTLRAELNGTDVSSVFVTRADGRTYGLL